MPARKVVLVKSTTNVLFGRFCVSRCQDFCKSWVQAFVARWGALQLQTVNVLAWQLLAQRVRGVIIESWEARV